MMAKKIDIEENKRPIEDSGDADLIRRYNRPAPNINVISRIDNTIDIGPLGRLFGFTGLYTPRYAAGMHPKFVTRRNISMIAQPAT